MLEVASVKSALQYDVRRKMSEAPVVATLAPANSHCSPTVDLFPLVADRLPIKIKLGWTAVATTRPPSPP